MKNLIIFVLIGVLCKSAFPANTDSIRFARLLPETIHGWHVQPPDEIYTFKTLYEYIDGGAELYLSFGFQTLFHRTYFRPNQSDILVDIYDMGSSENAFGLFMHDRTHVDSSFGQGSDYADGYLVFWKNHYFVSVLSMQRNPQSEMAIREIGHLIDQKIKRKGRKPNLINKLPKENQYQNSLRYFHHYRWLSRALHIPEKDYFNMGDSIEAALAQYRNSLTLALLHFPTEQQALKAKNNALRQLFKSDSTKTLVPFKGYFFVLKKCKSYLILIKSKEASNTDLLKLQKSILQKLYCTK